MSIDALPTIITLLIALSVATERGVEITKSLWPWLDTEQVDKRGEGRRRAAVQFLAVVFGVLIASLTWPVIAEVLRVTAGANDGRDVSTILAVGLLASGGSGFWHSMLSYVTSLKTLKSAEVKEQRAGAGQALVIPHPGEGRIGE